MSMGIRWRFLLILVVLLFGIIYTLPSLPGVKNSSLAQFLPSNQINLGLDLKGGIHLTLGVDVETALKNSLIQLGEDIREEARDKEIFILKPLLTKEGFLSFSLLKSSDQEKLDDLLQKYFPMVRVIKKERSGEQLVYVLAFKEKYKEQQSKMILDQAVKTIRNRIDQFGVAEPDIRKQADNRIQIQLPGLEDPDRAIRVIGKTAHLEFMLVDDSVGLEQVKQNILPPGRKIYYLYKTLPSGEESKQPIVLIDTPLLTGEYITTANVAFDSFGRPYVSLSFNARGAKIFERITGENVNKRLAIVLDGKVYSAPVIQEKIIGGRASITGNFSTDEAHDLAIVLRAGSLPAPVKILEERSVGPSLGQESIQKGVFSALLGGALVVIFMLIYYGFAGLIADTALIFNLILILAGLAAFGATLTLPGIAGIILTIGMAVDANVLIFERIREELRQGLTPRKAIAEGFSRATLTILDANVTTVIAAIILYQFGTGPIRGFAVTLTLGILASMFAAIFVSRAIFDWWLSSKEEVKTLNI
ncbi:MAG: Protein translocase subunit SecD [Desulfonauticus sp. 38_4375]|nr:MAG: Protein translocase subunit SecD [Desulfonauticus sp. 38_4375]